MTTLLYLLKRLRCWFQRNHACNTTFRVLEDWKVIQEQCESCGTVWQRRAGLPWRRVKP